MPPDLRPPEPPPPSPATTQLMGPAQPIAPPPTLVALAPDPAAASTARGIGAQALAAEPSPASTVKGFSPPQSYPVQLADAGAPQPTRPPPILLEVTPRGLGIATVAGFCEELIRRNSRVPTEIRKLFTTSRDQQDLVRIVVCQGESRRLDNNTVIGDLVLQNLPRRPRGETSIEVTFSLDPSGVLHVRARDAQTGVEQHATLALTGGVAQEDVAASRDRLQHLRR
jgi:molecular chaperone DnaK